VLGHLQSGLPQLRVASLQNREHQALARRAREWAEELLDDAGEPRSGSEALRRELERGWLARVHRAEPATAT
jgi:hypothetical protein